MFGGLIPKGSFRHLVAANTVSQLIGRAVSTVVMVIVSFLIAKYFGASGYGDFVKITTYVGFFYLFADFGLNAVFQQNVVHERNPSQARSVWQELFGLRLTMATVLVGIALVILELLPRGTAQGYTSLVRLGILMLVSAIIAQATTTTTNALFQKVLRYDYATLAQNAGSVTLFLVALILMSRRGINGAYVGVIAIFSGSVVTAVIALFLVKKIHGAVRPVFHVKTMVSELWKTFPLGMTLIFNLVYFHADSVILTLTRPTRDVGIYGLAYKVFELPLVFPLFFMNAVYPIVLRASGVSSYSRDIFWKSFAVLLVTAVGMGAIIWVAAPLITFVRPEFSASIAPLRILLLSLPVYFVSSLFMWMLIAKKRNWQLFTIHALAMIVNIVLNAVYVPTYGYVAAAWITGISELGILIVTAFYVYPLVMMGKEKA